MSFFKELQRRNVFRVGIAYAVASWLLAQVADIFFENFGAPAWVMQSFLILLVLGFPLALFLAWAFELTPEGVKRDSEARSAAPGLARNTRRLDRAIIVVLALALAWIAWDRFAGKAETRSDPLSAATTTESDQRVSQKRALTPSSTSPRSVAVLPFVAMSNGENDEFFADGLTEEILNSLAQLPDLMVTARTSSFHFKGQDLPVPQIAAQLGVTNIVEGSVRRNADQVRVTAQLVRAEDGFHLWSDTYDGSVSDGFDMQTRIAESVALALDVVLDDRQRERMRIAGLRDPEAFITLQKGVDLFQGAHGQGSDKQLEELQKANVYFEQVMESVPGYADAYAYHVDYFIHVALEQAETGVMPPEAAHDLEVIRELAQKDLDAAVQYAADAARKAENELTRAIFSENWRGLSAMVESALRADNCSGANWANIVSAPYGMADLLLEDSLTLTVCDPINPDGHTSAVAASIWLKDFDQAVKIGEAALNRVRTEWLISTYVTALVGHDQLAEAREAIRTLFRTESWAVATELLLAAHEGNLELAADLNERSSTSGSGSDSWQMMHKARLGDHDGANHHAALIDARPLGPMKLAQSIYLCFCGAPFDLEATPNFAKQLKESGLAWPPPESIRFPLKDW